MERMSGWNYVLADEDAWYAEGGSSGEAAAHDEEQAAVDRALERADSVRPARQPSGAMAVPVRTFAATCATCCKMFALFTAKEGPPGGACPFCGEPDRVTYAVANCEGESVPATKAEVLYPDPAARAQDRRARPRRQQLRQPR